MCFSTEVKGKASFNVDLLHYQDIQILFNVHYYTLPKADYTAIKVNLL